MLKTDYKDDVPVSGSRKYQITDNGDDTVTITDVTQYQQVGDSFGAADINATNTAVNKCVEYLSGTLASGATSVTISDSDYPDFFFDGGHVEVYVPSSKVRDLVVSATSITPRDGNTPSSCTVTFSSSVDSNSQIDVYCK